MPQHLHILGIGGTFMGGIAVIAQELGWVVSGSDKNLYPPMSTQLADIGVRLIEGYDPQTIKLKPDLWLIGNGISRGNPLLEAILETNEHYDSAPQWLYENVLRFRHVIAVAGTHGKTTTTSMVAFMLSRLAEDSKAFICGQSGYLIGGVCQDFSRSAHLGDNRYFVIEADEYDTALFDKRSKFVHYHPRTLICNNLEFDHADIFPDLFAIETQFHHLIRALPQSARIIANHNAPSLHRVHSRGFYSDWQWFNDPSGFYVRDQSMYQGDQHIADLPPNIVGQHNRNNALAAVLALSHINIPIKASLAALADFQGVKRRLELRAQIHGISIYDDFAHHPTAIRETIQALREHLPQSASPLSNARIIAVVEPRSNTMKLGVFAKELAKALQDADLVVGYGKNLGWDLAQALAPLAEKNLGHFETVESLIDALHPRLRAGDCVLGMSNGSFDGFYERLILALSNSAI